MEAAKTEESSKPSKTTTNLIKADAMKLSKNGEEYQVNEPIPLGNQKNPIDTVDSQPDETTFDQVHQEDSFLEHQQKTEKSKIQKTSVSDHESERTITEEPEAKGISNKIDHDERKFCNEDEEKTKSEKFCNEDEEKTNSVEDEVDKGNRNEIPEEASEIHFGKTISQDCDGNKTREQDNRKRKDDNLESLPFSCKKIKQEEMESNEELRENLQGNEKPTDYENNTEIMNEECRNSYEDRMTSGNSFRNNETYDFSDKEQLRNDTESKTNETECFFKKETFDDIKSENFGFDQDEMQSQRCVMAFNTYKRNSADYSDTHGEKILNVNIEKINAENKNLFKDNALAEKHTEHLGPDVLENVASGEVNFEKGDIKIEDDSEEDLPRMEVDQVDANQGKDAMDRDGIRNSEDKIPLPLAPQDRTFSSEDIENASMDAEDLLSLYFDNEVIYACEDCDFETETRVNLICHYKDNHHEDQRLDTTLKSDLKVPGNLTKSFQCRVCFFKAKYKKNLKLHYKFKHNYEGVLYECSHPVCSYVAEIKEDLLQHFRCCHVKRAVFIKRMK